MSSSLQPSMPCKHCHVVHCSDNELTGRIGSLPPFLWQLDISGNGLAGPLPQLDELPELEVLAIGGGNVFAGSLPGVQDWLLSCQA